jgi:hypothetical protein
VVTVVPSGYREFCYNLDGEFAVSKKHPTNSDGSCNWRTVYGPQQSRPDRSRAGENGHNWFVDLAVTIADSMQRIVPLHQDSDPDDERCHTRGSTRRCGRSDTRWASGSNFADVEVAAGLGMDVRSSKRKPGGTWIDRPLRLTVTFVAVYAAGTVVYVLWSILNTSS